MKKFLISFLLLCAANNASAFCAFNLSQNKFNLRVSYDGWSSDGTYAIEQGEQFCTMEGLQKGDIVHFHIYDTVDYGDYYSEYYRDYNLPSDVRMVITGYGQYWYMNTFKVAH